MEETSDPVVPASPGPENSSNREVLFITSGAGDDDEGDQSTCQATRSYECSFCKRGFSNAQALGGHMNIHRKDKVKSNQPPSLSNQIFGAHNYHHRHQFPKPTPSPLYCELTTIKPLESKFSTRMFSLEGDEVSRDETYLGENRQLLFLAETSSHDENQEQPSGTGEGFEQLGPELDLELRLWHDEPQTSYIGMKKFF